MYGPHNQTETVVIDVAVELLDVDVRIGILGVGVVCEIHLILSLLLRLFDGLDKIAVADGDAVDVRVCDHVLTAHQDGGLVILDEGCLETAVDDRDPVRKGGGGFD